MYSCTGNPNLLNFFQFTFDAVKDFASQSTGALRGVNLLRIMGIAAFISKQILTVVNAVIFTWQALLG